MKATSATCSISACFALWPTRPPTLARTPYPYARFVLATRLPLKFRGPSAAITWPRLVVRPSSIDVTPVSAIRPSATVESYKLPSDIRKGAMDPVDACGRRVTIGDVASRAGLKLDVAQRALQAIAADTDGFLQANSMDCRLYLIQLRGDILYVFPKGYRAKLAGKSLRMKIEPWIEKAKATIGENAGSGSPRPSSPPDAVPLFLTPPLRFLQLNGGKGLHFTHTAGFSSVQQSDWAVRPFPLFSCSPVITH